MRSIFVASALAVASVAPFAQAQSAAAPDATLLAELKAAADAAAPFGEARFAFTMTYVDKTDAQARPLRLRFDPRKAEGARWTMLDPAPAALSEDERKTFKSFARRDEADDQIVYDRLGESLVGARLLSADATRATFAIAINDPALPDAARKALAATLSLDRAGGYVDAMTVASTAPFKPAAVAKVTRMRQQQRFAPLGPGLPAVLVETRAEVAGKAMLKSFNQNAVMTYVDIEIVDAPARPEIDRGE